MTMSRVWKFGADVDTDQIVPGRYAPYMRPGEDVGQFAFIEARPDFARDAQPGDVIVAGANFGCGSSREYAPEALRRRQIGAIIAPIPKLTIKPTLYIAELANLMVEDFAPLVRRTFENEQEQRWLLGAELEASLQVLRQLFLEANVVGLAWLRTPGKLARPLVVRLSSACRHPSAPSLGRARPQRREAPRPTLRN